MKRVRARVRVESRMGTQRMARRKWKKRARRRPTVRIHYTSEHILSPPQPGVYVGSTIG
jgi:hypothetical protein